MKIAFKENLRKAKKKLNDFAETLMTFVYLKNSSIRIKLASVFLKTFYFIKWIGNVSSATRLKNEKS